MLEPAERATGFSSRKAREAGDSIKPGAPAPGSRTNKYFEAREAGDSAIISRLSPAPRARSLFIIAILGLRSQSLAPPQALCCHLLRRLKTASPASQVKDSESSFAG